MLCGDGDDHSGRQVRFVDLHLYAHEISKLLPSYRSVNCCHHIYNKNSCVVVFETVKCVALPGLSLSYEQSKCWCLADGVRRGVGAQHLNRI